jgi:hypothetical protein
VITLDRAPPNPFGREVLNGPADFVPDWDVSSIGKSATDALLRAIDRAQELSAQVDTDRKIHVLLGPPGYGKTHLFGRLNHALGDRVLFVFIPPIEDVRRPLSHIRHHVVMSVFHKGNTARSALETALARLCRPSFLQYLSTLPRSFDAQYAAMRDRLQDSHNLSAVWEITDQVKAVEPFLALGDSIARSLNLNGPVGRALSLGWSPEHAVARSWLRGESLPEELARRLGLPDDPPAPVDVLKAIAMLLAGHAPLVLCIDQLDVLLTDQENAPLQFSSDLMVLRSAIPNLLIILGCIKVEWERMAKQFNQAFVDRTCTHELETLTPQQSTELISRRLSSWPGKPSDRGEWWPIDEAPFRTLVAEPQRPRGLIKTCENAYQDWADQGDWDRLVVISPGGQVDKLTLFQREWDKELEAISLDKGRSHENCQDQRLARAIKGALALLADAPRESQSRSIFKTVGENPVPQVAGNPDPFRYSFKIELKGRSGAKSIIIALEVNHSGQKFAHYFDGVMKLIVDPIVGAVFLTARAHLPAGPKTTRDMDIALKKGRLRTITLTDYPADFERLECYLTLLDRALSQNLQLGTSTVPVDEYRDLAAKSGVLANLSLNDQIVNGWVDPPEDDEAQGAAGGAKTVPAVHEKPTTRPDRELAPEPKQSVDDPTTEARLEWADKGLETIVNRLGELSARVRSSGVTHIGPTFARFLVTPFPATTIGKVRNRAEDLKIALVVDRLPLVGSQEGAISIDVELPEAYRKTLSLKNIGPAPPKCGTSAPVFPVGQDVSGVTHWLDFADPNTCHLLVAGTTGSGKSEFLKALIAALATRLGPDRVRFALIDPKQVTFNFGEHPGSFLVRPVAHGADEALAIVKDCFAETEKRYSELRARKLEDLAQWQDAEPKTAPPRIVIIFDEFADLMAEPEAKKALEVPLKRLGAKARAAGVHLVLATQRPEASVVTPLLRSNLPARVCMRVASPADSNIVLKKPDGADLLGRGDLLWQHGAGLVRLQSPIVSLRELHEILFPKANGRG